MSSVAALFRQEDAKRTLSSTANRQYLSVGQMPINSNMLVRLLGRTDPGILPFVVKDTITLRFAGITGSDHDNNDETTVRVPSMTTWGQRDYIQETTKPFWKGSEEEKNIYARPYYKRPAYIYACFAVSVPYVEQEPPINPLRLIAFSTSIQKQIVAALSDADLDWAPWDVVHGLDLKVAKVQKGTWPDYTGTAFGRKERALSAVELAAIDKHGLPDLDAELGEPPTAEVQDIIKAMYHASVAGEPFDNKLWGAHFKAWGAYGNKNATNGATSTRGGKTTLRVTEPGTSSDEVMDAVRSRVSSTTAEAPTAAAAD